MKKLLLLVCAVIAIAFSLPANAQQYCSLCRNYTDGAQCVISWGNGYCGCISTGHACEPILPICSTWGEKCQYGTGPAQQIAREIVSKGKTTIAMVLGRTCARGNLGKALREEAAAQGKELHIISPPANMTKEDVKDYNELLRLWSAEMARITKARDLEYDMKQQ